MTKASSKHSQSDVDWNVVNNMQYSVEEIETPHMLFFEFTVQQKDASHAQSKRLCILK